MRARTSHRVLALLAATTIAMTGCGDDETTSSSDDVPEVVEDRLAVWARTGPVLLDRYARREMLVSVDGTGSISEVSARVWTAATAAIDARPAN